MGSIIKAAQSGSQKAGFLRKGHKQKKHK